MTESALIQDLAMMMAIAGIVSVLTSVAGLPEVDDVEVHDLTHNS